MTVVIEIIYKTPLICISSALPIYLKIYIFSVHWPEKVTEELNFKNRIEYFTKNRDI